MAMRRAGARAAAWLEPKLRRLGTVLLVVLLVLVLIDIWHVVIGAGWRATLAIVLVTALRSPSDTCWAGRSRRHERRPPSAARRVIPDSRCWSRRLTHASPAITATVLAYLLIAAVTLIPYVLWRKRDVPSVHQGD